MFFWNKFCGLVTFFLVLATSSHGQIAKTQSNLLQNKTSDSVYHYFIFYNPIAINNQTKINQEIPPDFATCKYGFFCKQEMKFEKATSIPLRIRLGSLAQCNYYEGKTGWSSYLKLGQ
jgi:hypothetical protein